MVWSATVPIHLEGNNGPVAEECDVVATRVVGEVPGDLRGRFYRNGPNPRSGWSPHLYAGDGMVHMVDVTSRRYRNRYVRTPLYADPGLDRGLDHRVTTANTHVVLHEGRLLALEEGGFPYEMTAELDTIGPFTFDGRLAGAMTAHPKRCPRTGDLLFFGYSVRRPFLTYHCAPGDGGALRSVAIELPACSLMHDFAITATKVLFVDSCLVFDLTAAQETGSPWRWDDTRAARIGVLERADPSGPVRWFDVEPCHLSHAANAFDAGDTVVLTGTRIPPDGQAGGMPVMYEWRLDLTTGIAAESALDDVSTEYPRVPDALVGLPMRYVYVSGFFFEAEPDHGEIHKYDMGTRTTYRLPYGHTCGEPVFVPGAGSRAEDDGYLVTFAHDRVAGTSSLVILDAIAMTVTAEVHLPVRVPGGFHGTWVPEP
jgi:carotenoid cleavage dioxygenase